jgi:hypothetical protein
MKIVLLNIVAAALLVFSVASCGKKAGKDEKKAEACAVNEPSNKASEDGDACKACCEGAGYDGYMWMLGKGCKCQ